MISLQNGIRCNELVNIMVNQINFENKSIHLLATKSHRERDVVFKLQKEGLKVVISSNGG